VRLASPILRAASAGLLAGLCAAAVGPLYVNHDAAWYLHMAGVWLDGGTLYRDVIDTNPPLIVFLTALPVLTARAFGAFEPTVFKAVVFAAGGVVLWTGSHLISRIWATEGARQLPTIVLAFAVFPFVGLDFGQREHLASMLVVAYVLAACAWATGNPVGARGDAAAGVAGALGFAIKPHFLMAWLAVELALLLLRPAARSWRRPAVLAAVATFLAYAAVVPLLAPAYLAVALEVVQVYGGLNAPVTELLRIRDVRAWVVMAVAVAMIRLPREHRPAVLILFAAASGFFVAGMVQAKGWGYHFYPFRLFALLSGAALLSAVIEAWPAALEAIRGGRMSVTAAVLAAVTLWSGRAVSDAWKTIPYDHARLLASVVHRQEHAESLALLSMRNVVYPAFPLVTYTGAEWVLRHNGQWFLPGLYAEALSGASGTPVFRPVGDMPALERLYFRQIVDDLCARPPRLLIVEPPVQEAPAGGRSLDLVSYYRQDEGFDRLFSAYAPVTRVGPYVVYLREGAGSCRADRHAGPAIEP
jgi:hypothetical protein